MAAFRRDYTTIKMHHEESFMDTEELEYVGGGMKEIHPTDINKVSSFEILGLAMDVGFSSVEEFYYLILGSSLGDGLRTCYSYIGSLDMATMARLERKLVMCFIHRVNSTNVIPKVPTLRSPTNQTKLSNVDPYNRAQSIPHISLKKMDHVSPHL